MKNRKSFGLIMVMFVFTACNKSDEISANTIEGTYWGTLALSSGQKSTSVQSEVSATVVVTIKGDALIEVHCFGSEIDTTFMLNYYENSDSIMVCLTGSDFQNTYGHMLGQGHMMGGMMGDITNGETEWQHHMEDEHQQGDEHFGGFDMGNQTFGYHFKMMNGNMPYYLDFQGKKN